MAKKDFWIEFHRSRKERARELVVGHYENDLYQVSSQSQADPYFVSANDDIQCECEDFANQVKARFSHPMCKHGWALLGYLGFSSLSAYIQSNQGVKVAVELPPTEKTHLLMCYSNEEHRSVILRNIHFYVTKATPLPSINNKAKNGQNKLNKILLAQRTRANS
jgi:hypothetical protein